MPALPCGIADVPSNAREQTPVLQPKLRKKIPPPTCSKSKARSDAFLLRGMSGSVARETGGLRPDSHDLQRQLPPVAPQQRTALEVHAALIARLESEGAEDLALPLRGCGDGLALVCQNCGIRHETITHCKKRWCPLCARIVSAKRLDKYAGVIDVMRSPIFVTLTMPHRAETSSPEDVRTLRRALGKFRKKKWYTRRVSGGIASIEVTCGEHGWHPHIHMLIEAKWFSVTVPPPDRSYSPVEQKKMMADSQREVVWQWQQALGIHSGGGVYISRARAGVAREILKYAVKPSDLADSSWPLAPLLRTLAVTRLITTWGSVRKNFQKMASLKKDADKTPAICECGESCWMPEHLLPKNDAEKNNERANKACKERAAKFWENRRSLDEQARRDEIHASLRAWEGRQSF